MKELDGMRGDPLSTLFWVYFFMTSMLLSGVFLNGVSLIALQLNLLSWSETQRVGTWFVTDLVISAVFATVMVYQPWLKKR